MIQKKMTMDSADEDIFSTSHLGEIFKNLQFIIPSCNKSPCLNKIVVPPFSTSNISNNTYVFKTDNHKDDLTLISKKF